MTDGRYVYCILNSENQKKLGKIGILDTMVYTINHNDISAVVSTMPFKEFEPKIDNIVAHQRVVDTARKIETALPVRFGVIFKGDEGVKRLLKKSYKNFKTKLHYLKDKDEIGIKVLLDKKQIEKIKQSVSDNSDEIKKLKKDISSSGEGTAYFLKMRLDDAIKNEVLQQINKLASQIHKEISDLAVENRLFSNELDNVVLNSAYLINKSDYDNFNKNLELIKKHYKLHNLSFHMSGPWAPYSFC